MVCKLCSIFRQLQTVSFNKMHWKMSSAKWQPSCLSFNVIQIQIQIQIGLFDIIIQNETWIDTYILHLTLVSYPRLNFKVVGMEILIKAWSHCHKDHHKGKKEAFSVVIREALIFPNDCMENSQICQVRLARSISVVFNLISLCNVLRVQTKPKDSIQIML